MASEEIPYEETKHLFNPDQDTGTCKHVWRWKENYANPRGQVTRVCVVCHTSSGFPNDVGFLLPRFIEASNANLRHYAQMKALEQQLAVAREEAERWKQARDIAFQMSIERQNQLEAENDTMCAILEAMPEPVYETDAGYIHCTCCQQGQNIDVSGTPVHAADCTWTRRNAFLAEHKEQPNG